MDSSLLTLSLFLLLVPTMYLYTVGVVATRFPTLRNKRICLLIAHPDDEAMFFAPTVLALTRPELGNHVKILCLSSGDAEGLGETRKQELVESGLVLGLRKAEDVFVVDNPTYAKLPSPLPPPSRATFLSYGLCWKGGGGQKEESPRKRKSPADMYVWFVCAFRAVTFPTP